MIGRQCNGTTCFPGYINPVSTGVPEELKQHPLFAAVPGEARYGDPLASQTSEMLKVSTAKFEELTAAEHRVTYRKDLRKEYGTHGQSLLDEYLGHYVDPLNAFPVPIYHAALLGVVKLFLSVVFSDLAKFKGVALPPWVFTKEMRRVISDRAGEVIMTNDFNRPYRDVVARRGYWTAEEYLHFLDLSFVILRPLEDGLSVWPHSNLEAAWASLRRSLLHYFRDEEDGFDHVTRARAYNDLYDFAMRWEGLVGPRLATYNLHQLVCRLFQQEEARGPVSYDGELWVERAMGHFRRSVRTTISPELIYVSDILSDIALRDLGSTSSIRDWERTCREAASKKTPRLADQGGTVEGINYMCLGPGTAIPQPEVPAACRLWTQSLNEGGASSIGPEWARILQGDEQALSSGVEVTLSGGMGGGD